jgi:hypothetical protein
MTDRREALRALLRQDLPSFVQKCFATLEPGKQLERNWHIDHIAHHLARVRAGEDRRLIVNIPPRHLKSVCVTVAFTAWAMGHDPSLRVMTMSYAHELARKHAADFRTIVRSDWYRDLFPSFVIAQDRQMEIGTTLQGSKHRSDSAAGCAGRDRALARR